MPDRPLAIVSVLSLLGTLGLYGYSVLVPPDGIPGTASVEGAYVRVEGLVGEVKVLSNGALGAEILPGGRRPGVRLYVPPDLDPAGAAGRLLLTGAMVRADGRLQEYKGEMEVVLDHAQDLRQLRPSGLSWARKHPEILANASVCLAGLAFYKELAGGRLTFCLLDPADRTTELDCSAASYDPAREKERWENGTLVRVLGRLRYFGDPPIPRLYVLGGAAGVEPLG